MFFFFFEFIRISIIVKFNSIFQKNALNFAIFEHQSKFTVIDFYLNDVSDRAKIYQISKSFHRSKREKRL